MGGAACEDHGVTIIARCILDEGGLTGFLELGAEFAPGDFRDGDFDEAAPRQVDIETVEADVLEFARIEWQRTAAPASPARSIVASNWFTSSVLEESQG